MSTSIYLYRCPVEPAFDLLARHRWFHDFEFSERWDSFFHHSYSIYGEELEERRPTYIDLGVRHYIFALDVMTGGVRHPIRNDEYEVAPPPVNPYWRAIYGSRRVGWEESDFSVPLYSLPSDVAKIHAAMQKFSIDEAKSNAERVFETIDTTYYQDESSRTFLIETYIPRLVTALSRFYDAAHHLQQIVISRKC